MLNKIDLQLEKIKKSKRVGLMTHVAIGYPSLVLTKKLVGIMEKSGADFIELQIPFSDPIADGATIMKACEVALKLGTKVADCLKITVELSKTAKIPLLLMVYYNTVFNFGVEKFCQQANLAGVSGLIVPDIPPEQEKEEGFFKFCYQYKLYPIRLVSPASNKKRLKINAKLAKGFVYCIARFGTTGAKAKLDPKLKNYLKRVKQYFHLPLAVGFGISKPEHIKALEGLADIAIVGSAIINIIKKEKENFLPKVGKFIRSLKDY